MHFVCKKISKLDCNLVVFFNKINVSCFEYKMWKFIESYVDMLRFSNHLVAEVKKDQLVCSFHYIYIFKLQNES